MSTISTNPPLDLAASTAPHGVPQGGLPLSPLPYGASPTSASASAEWEEPTYGGLTPSAWLKVGTVAVLMALLFRFNLSRLWLKTNPFTGQANWGHAFFVPIIGLYFLYVHRQELAKPPPAAPVRGSLAMAWGLWSGVWLVALTLFFVAIPGAAAAVGSAALVINLLDNYHGWPLGPVYLALLGWVVLGVRFALAARQVDGGRAAADRAAQSWPHLLAWGMAVLTAWGVAFFISVVLPQGTALLKILLSLASLLLLGVLVFGEGRPVARSVDRIAARLADGSALWFGGFVMAWGVLFSFWGIWPGQNDFFKDVGMVIALFGVVLLLGGWGVMRTAWFPVLFLFCALPWPDQVYSWLAGPLQHLAAAVATRVLTIFGVPSLVSGTKIVMNASPGEPPRILNVAEACAGLRSLMTFVSLAAGWAFLFMASRPLWHRLFLAASAVPIAILCNVMRVSGQGLLDKFISHQLSEGFAHQFAGLVMLIPAFFMILLVGWVLDHLFIEEADEDEAVVRVGTAGAAGTAGTAAATAPLAVANAGTAGTASLGKPVRDAGKAGKVLVVPRPGVASASRTTAAAKPPGTKSPAPPAAPRPAPAARPPVATPPGPAGVAGGASAAAPAGAPAAPAPRPVGAPAGATGANRPPAARPAGPAKPASGAPAAGRPAGPAVAPARPTGAPQSQGPVPPASQTPRPQAPRPPGGPAGRPPAPKTAGGVGGDPSTNVSRAQQAARPTAPETTEGQ